MPEADPRATRLRNLARTLAAIPHIDRYADCGCPRWTP